MTSTTDMTEHPDVTEIADLTEGLLTPSRTADIQRHLDTCELCADVSASLAEVHDLLGAEPEPVAMPTDIAERIDVALAAEALRASEAQRTAEVLRGAEVLRASEAPQPIDSATDSTQVSRETPRSPTASATVSRETQDYARPSPDSDSDAHVSRETSVAADRPTGHARPSTTGPGRKKPDRSDRSKRRRVTVIGAAFAAAAVGLGSVLLSSLMGGGASGPPAGDDQTTTASDTFSTESLERQVTDLLSTEPIDQEATSGGSRSPLGSMGVEGGDDVVSPRVFQTPSVPDCVRKGIGRQDAALAVDEGVYKGTDAMLVVLPDANDISRVTAYIMDSTCVKRASSDIAKILFQTSYAHP
ncbi:anti-sigma factor family protein [Streptomyces sp. NPDC059477]|uniref:anti-sigma factor family protein n=1 Tax=Streptomyces sp. NPDC059477 TaxID=3346847 RepID=UPI0036883DC9